MAIERCGSTVFAAIQEMDVGTAPYADRVRQLSNPLSDPRERMRARSAMAYINPRMLKPTRSFFPAVGMVIATPTTASENGTKMCKNLEGSKKSGLKENS